MKTGNFNRPGIKEMLKQLEQEARTTWSLPRTAAAWAQYVVGRLLRRAVFEDGVCTIS